jgi:hypothetical protein
MLPAPDSIRNGPPLREFTLFINPGLEIASYCLAKRLILRHDYKNPASLVRLAGFPHCFEYGKE